jgi:hypothetical protein
MTRTAADLEARRSFCESAGGYFFSLQAEELVGLPINSNK